VQVFHDIMGLFEDFVPKHAKRYAQLADAIRRAAAEYLDDVRTGRFPEEQHSFDADKVLNLTPEELKELRGG
jgi:3-methyl-2-oxobutanoate hydroxymethyltransferase